MKGDRVRSAKKIHCLYWEQLYSIPQISEKLGISVGKVHKLMAEAEIPRRSSRDGRLLNPPEINYARGDAHHFFGKSHSTSCGARGRK